MGVEELDRELLIKLVDKIVVGQKAVVDDVERQEITITYNLVGQINWSSFVGLTMDYIGSISSVEPLHQN